MKKTIFAFALLFAGITSATAQEGKRDFQLFNHLGLSVGVGLTGITADLSTTCTPFLGIRAGADFMPRFHKSFNMDMAFENDGALSAAYSTMFPGETLPEKVKVKLSPTMHAGHLLVDIYPGTKTKFHFTVGAYYYPKSSAIELVSKEDVWAHIETYNNSTQAQTLGRIGLDLGDYFLTPENGQIDASIRTKNFRPYIGIGSGRSVPKKRVGFQFDAGVQLWGSPEVYLADHKLEKGETNSEGNKILKTVSKIKIYPSISFRLVGRIF